MNNFDLLTDNQKAFVRAIRDSAGVPESATIEYLLTDTYDNFLRYSPYREWYDKLVDCHGVWFAALKFESNRCYMICENIALDGDGHNCADAISESTGA